MTRIDIVSNSDTLGGANRAAYRLYRALRTMVPSTRMTVAQKKSDDWGVQAPAGFAAKAQYWLRPKIGFGLLSLQKSADPNTRSVNILPSRLHERIDTGCADVVNLHWVGGETMSIEDLGRIRKPVVWTFHDMWPLCGAEHFAGDGPEARWRHGYRPDNRNSGASGLDIDRHTWNRKRRAWTRPLHVVTPSRWLADCVAGSALLAGWPVSVVPNVLDTQVFKPLDRAWSRYALNLASDAHIVLFGALGGSRDARKGYDLLLATLAILATRRADIRCVVLGQGEPEHGPALPFPVTWIGHVSDDATLALLYSAADVVVTPSRQENLPQSATEAHACACPVVAFDCGGLPDVVEHGGTGYLARPFDPADLAHGIEWVLDDPERRRGLGAAARARAQRLWSPRAVLPAYLDVFEAARAAQARSERRRAGAPVLAEPPR
jgi:glycosyltransferase involved in cell wall biosynthesis